MTENQESPAEQPRKGSTALAFQPGGGASIAGLLGRGFLVLGHGASLL